MEQAEEVELRGAAGPRVQVPPDAAADVVETVAVVVPTVPDGAQLRLRLLQLLLHNLQSIFSSRIST